MAIQTTTKEVTRENSNGDREVTTQTITKNVFKNEEPDYIKLYVKMWTHFCYDGIIPEKYIPLFISLAVRMNYCDSTDLKHSQIVYTGGFAQDEILKECGWKTRGALSQGLKVLCDCNAIKRTEKKGWYQINPHLASKGNWKYNPRLQHGGVENLIATFNFKENTVNSQILFHSADENYENDILYQTGNFENGDEVTEMTYTEHPEFKKSNKSE